LEWVDGDPEPKEATEVARDEESPGVGGHESFEEDILVDGEGIGEC
jgi:hypothetical protein